jgi:gamma-glutamyltranspeptidase/glutathione hydrolase
VPKRSLQAVIGIVACLVGCRNEPPPAPAPPPAAKPVAVGPADAGAPPSAQTGSGSGSAIAYRAADATFRVDPTVVGTGKTYVAVSESVQATAVGKQVLADGGNAVDAAVAIAFALAVVHPSAGNLAGGGFAVVHTDTGERTALDFRETAPAAATRDMYVDPKTNKPAPGASTTGYLSVATPAEVAGLFALHKKLGKKPWRDVVAPAIAFARDGFVVDEHTRESIGHRADCLRKFPATAAIWLPGGAPPTADAKVTIPDLAAVLQRIADRGPDGFATGATADLIVAEMKRGGGLVTAADLAGYKPVWRTPLVTTYRGFTFITMPPPSSGGIVLALTANMLRGTDLHALGWHSTEHVHRIVEVWRRAFAARNELRGDPAFLPDMPVDKLMSTAYADKLAATIGPRATPSTDVTNFVDGTHTTNISVVDARGEAVALTTTLNASFGSCVTVAGGGFLLNDEMDDFTSQPGTPNMFGLVQGTANAIAPGKRMLSSMSPTVVLDKAGAVFAVAGAGGGPRIITAVWQTLSNVVDFQLAGDVAVAAPRLHHQHLPDNVLVEADSITKDTADALRAMGYDLHFAQFGREFAAVTAIVRAEHGWIGTADPRSGGGAAGD